MASRPDGDVWNIVEMIRTHSTMEGTLSLIFLYFKRRNQGRCKGLCLAELQSWK